MNNVKKQFSIRDLENLSGIKAHTIRIWEKRYNLLSPERTDTNIRLYSLASLQKLLNITLLYQNGHKISKIAKISDKDIPYIVREIVTKHSHKSQAINAFKLAMVNFDQTMFFETYNALLSDNSFKEIFLETFVPLLNELGLLWQTDTISPAHEHFISSLIKQKILINIEKLQHLSPTKKDKVFVAYLPENEIHEIGLLYVNYEILLKGYQCIYLGPTIPIENLEDLLKYFKDIYFVSYFTVFPDKDRITKYLEDFSALVSGYDNPNLWLLGRQTSYIDKDTKPAYCKTFSSIQSLVKNL
ncbi:MerR family transcriptional regulator [Maribacter hydrothermalis]|uniref:MerR family transcriptional regulator n=1 Tax=Maribacter hydrothermalis TaxID=1836467 RepID=A0A1B7Z1V3_9FLAO|nr:MerR family transcriptional regulator [Maribacter hydrothermalis]APQ18349.1 MerR family transcriptional regulator [Maribacter hydrothermalis]OBR36695.1 MerR family transcriptional regulator [Maribacter hydrothermalis]